MQLDEASVISFNIKKSFFTEDIIPTEEFPHHRQSAK